MIRLLFISAILVLFLSFCDCSPKSPIKERTTKQSVSVEADKEAPYHAALEYDDNIICSGSGITARYILTAAHCFEYVNIIYQSQKFKN